MTLQTIRSIPPLLLCAALASGCATTSGTGPYSPQSEGQRDPVKAAALANQAEPLMAKDPAQAEKLLREALTADLYYGPAHNNLGVILLRQGKLYDAAGEFEWARKVMPGLPDPRFNLALTLENAGRTNEAIAMYDNALSVYPGHLQTTQALARLQVRSGKVDARTLDLLREIALRGESEQWRDWARRQMASRGVQ
jgi:tetratricopeptide (TPR) repeat protein